MTKGQAYGIINISNEREVIKMIKLTNEEKATLAKVIFDMCHNPMTVGTYDARNGNEDFILGIAATMEFLLEYISDSNIDFVDLYSDKFVENMSKSKERAICR